MYVNRYHLTLKKTVGYSEVDILLFFRDILSWIKLAKNVIINASISKICKIY